ncbi:hypothetical protein OQ644_13855, partial [Escherichia coli]|nr:hypothetical protein [Escherichia coli]
PPPPPPPPPPHPNQKTPYQMSDSLVGSEMCIRDSPYTPCYRRAAHVWLSSGMRTRYAVTVR